MSRRVFNDSEKGGNGIMSESIKLETRRDLDALEFDVTFDGADRAIAAYSYASGEYIGIVVAEDKPKIRQNNVKLRENRRNK